MLVLAKYTARTKYLSAGRTFEMKDTSEQHRTTVRILDIMEMISEYPGELSLSALSRALRIPKGTLSPILHTLVERNYLGINAALKYEIGQQAFFVGNVFLQRFSALDELEKILISLTENCMEASHLAILRGGNAVYLKKVNSPQPIRMVSSVGGVIPAYATGLGKALLIDHSRKQLEELYPEGLVPLTPNTVADLDALERQLKAARAEGFSSEVEESNEYIRCLAVPLRRAGKVIAAISVATPVFRYDEEKEKLIKALLKDAQEKAEALIRKFNIDFEEKTDR